MKGQADEILSGPHNSFVFCHLWITAVPNESVLAIVYLFAVYVRVKPLNHETAYTIRNKGCNLKPFGVPGRCPCRGSLEDPLIEGSL